MSITTLWTILKRISELLGQLTIENVLSQQTMPSTSSAHTQSQTSTPIVNPRVRTLRGSTLTTGSQSMSNRHSAIRQSRNSRDFHPENIMTEHLQQQTDNSSLHNKYLQLQIERTQIAIEREKLQKELVEIEVMKARTMMMDEINFKKELMQIELEAKRRALNIREDVQN